jgi:hypothetical protein
LQTDWDNSGKPIEHSKDRSHNSRMKTMIGILIVCGMVATGQTPNSAASIKITSHAFSPGGQIPKKYTCNGPNVNPPLHIDNVPKTAKTLALIVDDPDAPSGTWVHWVVWNINPKTTDISDHSVPRDAVQGTSDFGEAKYGGPCPPSGTHRYFFKAYALDNTLSLSSSSKKAALEKAMAGHILAQGSLMGTYVHSK